MLTRHGGPFRCRSWLVLVPNETLAAYKFSRVTSLVTGDIMDRVAFPDPGIFAVPAPTESIFSCLGILCELGHEVGSRGLHCNEAAVRNGYVNLKPLS